MDAKTPKNCHRHMYKSEFKSGNLYVTAEEIQAAKEAEVMNKENKNGEKIPHN